MVAGRGGDNQEEEREEEPDEEDTKSSNPEGLVSLSGTSHQASIHIIPRSVLFSVFSGISCFLLYYSKGQI